MTPAALLLTTCVCFAAGGPVRAAAGSFEFREGVVVDPGSGVVYVMNDRDGIDAIRLRDARRLWTTRGAQKPLLLVGRTLVAQVDPGGQPGRLELVFIDARGGVARGRTEIALPGGVVAGIDEGPGTRFEARASAAPDGCIIDWTYMVRPIQVLRNVPPPDSAERRWAGSVRVWPATGRAEPLDTPGGAGESLPGFLAALRDAGRLPGPVRGCEDVWLSAGRDPGGDGLRVERWRRTDGKPLPVLRVRTEPAFTLRYPSADCRHLLVSRRVQGGNAGPRYEWLVHSLAGGRQIARFEQDIPAAWFFIRGAQLIHEVQAEARIEEGQWVLEPKKVRALDLRTGSERWSIPLRNTMYRGLMPPGGPSGPADPAGGMPGRPDSPPHPERGEP